VVSASVSKVAVARRERLWFGLQAAFFLALLATPLVQRQKARGSARLAGLGLVIGGVALAMAGYRQLGQSHSPWSTPNGAGLVTTGVYGRIRHPIYAGWCLSGLGFEVLTGSRVGIGVAGGLIAFYDIRARQEDKLLTDQYSGAADYCRTVARLVPGVS
jgi:protein-S-isoprenylcysteine O-methyltransferase Ste14